MRVKSLDIGLRNLAYCDAEWNCCQEGEIIIHQWTLKDLMPTSSNINRVVTEKLVEKIVEFIKDIVLNNDDFDVLVVERQKRGVSKMVTLSHSIQCVCQVIYPNKPVIFYSAKHKLNVLPSWFNKSANDVTAAIVSAQNLKEGHYKNKKTAIAVTAEILRTTPQLKDNLLWFNKNKEKQDDIADAFLQALAYIKNNNVSISKNKNKRSCQNTKNFDNGIEEKMTNKKLKNDNDDNISNNNNNITKYFKRTKLLLENDVDISEKLDKNNVVVDLTDSSTHQNVVDVKHLDFSNVIDLTML